MGQCRFDCHTWYPNDICTFLGNICTTKILANSQHYISPHKYPHGSCPFLGNVCTTKILANSEYYISTLHSFCTKRQFLWSGACTLMPKGQIYVTKVKDLGDFAINFGRFCTHWCDKTNFLWPKLRLIESTKKLSC